jgi:hypothetical protein
MFVLEGMIYHRVLSQKEHDVIEEYVDNKYTLKDVDVSKKTSLTPAGPQDTIVITRRYGVQTIFPNDHG